MLHAALSGAPRAQVLAPYADSLGPRVLKDEVAAIAKQTYPPGFTPPASDGGALNVLSLARWCLATTGSFRAGALRAVNLGGNSDVISAVYGQLAGAHYGVAAIPALWRQSLLNLGVIEQLADRLLRNALVKLGEHVKVS